MKTNRDDRSQRIKRVLRRTVATLVIILSCLGVVACVLGIFGTWRLRGTLEVRGTQTLAQLNTALGVANQSLQVVNTNLDAIDAAQLIAVGHTLNAIPDIVVSFNTTLESLNQIPFVSVPTIDTEQLQRISERIDRVTSALAAVRQRRAEAGAAANVEAELAALRAASADLESQVRMAQVRIAAVEESWQGWIDRAAIVFTLLLIWLAFAQASLGRFVWINLRQGDRA